MVVGRVRLELPVGGERLFAVLTLELVLLGVVNPQVGLEATGE